MPSFAGILTSEELDDLIAFLESRVARTTQTYSDSPRGIVASGTGGAPTADEGQAAGK
jgi:mono/diheme cytochrome c family protein